MIVVPCPKDLAIAGINTMTKKQLGEVRLTWLAGFSASLRETKAGTQAGT